MPTEDVPFRPSPEGQRGADRNLLFGVMALRVAFIDRDQLVAAMNTWVLENTMPLGKGSGQAAGEVA
jgi:hypothetical protein